jgi:2-phosphoglycerate kinase
MCRSRTLSEQGRWFLQKPDEYAALSHRSCTEEFEMVVADLALYNGSPVIAEGVSLLPEMLHHVASSDQVVFLIAYEQFQRTRYMNRGFAQQWFSALPDPDAAFDNLMKCNDLMARQCYDAATRYGFKVIVVDESTPVDTVYSQVIEHFGL